MNYALSKSPKNTDAGIRAFASVLPLVARERFHLSIACIGILINASANLLGPIIISQTVDRSIQQKDLRGVLASSALLLFVYLCGLLASYTQTMQMGTVGRRVLFQLRNEIFTKLQSLPIAFFNQNKAGDLISRINNDTDRMNQFFAQGLVQFAANFFLMLGAAIFMFTLNIRLGLAALVPALGVVVITQLLSPWVRRRNLRALESTGDMSAEIQESINNFKVIVAFNRLDYFRNKFRAVNEQNYAAAIQAGVANNVFTPVYSFATSLAQLIVLAYGVTLIMDGRLTVGLLIGFFLYVNNFYQPLRQIANIWPSLQQALAALERIAEILRLKSALHIALDTENPETKDTTVLVFQHVSFAYPDGVLLLKNISMTLERGKTYALVGPTGGGKTTTAMLMARLYDPTEGSVLLDGKDLRSYSDEERAQKIGFILQEPFLFSGTVLENIFYGNTEFQQASLDEKLRVLHETHLDILLQRFDKGLDTLIQSGGETVSLGQRQLIAFMRAVLRKPEILILDEATANIDTVTEKLLGEVLQQLPKQTTKVIIAHRLNTIENADEIYFVNSGEVAPAGNLDRAIKLLMQEDLAS